MKKITILFFAFLVLCSCQAQNSSVNNKETQVKKNNVASTTKIEQDETVLDYENYVPPKSNEKMAICNLFPDPYFALDISKIFNKKVTDIVTYKELASYKGDLYIGAGYIKSLKGIGFLTGLTGLDSTKNEVTTIPSEIGKLKNLKYLNLLKSYEIKTISEQIGKLQNLEFLRLDMTNVKSIPNEICNIKSLKYLHLSTTAIKELPKKIGNLTNLEVLAFSSTKISILPESICRLKKLKMLNAGYTNISYLPQNFGNLSSLEVLDVFGCKLTNLPSSMKNLKKLKYLNVYDNINLSENYKQWYAKSVYQCKTDPRVEEKNNNEWYYYNKK